MKNQILLSLFFIALAAGENGALAPKAKFPKIVALDGTTYNSAEVSKIDDQHAKILHSNGIAKVAWKLLPVNVQSTFGMDDAALKEKAKKARDNKVQQERQTAELNEFRKKEALQFLGGYNLLVGQMKGKLNFEALHKTVMATYETGVKYSQFPELGVCREPALICLHYLGRPDIENKNKDGFEYSWANAVANPLTGRLDIITFRMEQSVYQNTRTGEIHAVLRSYLKSSSGDKLELPVQETKKED